MANDYPTINEFKILGDGVWRIDWRGAIEKNPSIESEYAVKVIVSKLKTDWQNTNTATDEAVEEFTRRSISIGVGQLPFLQLGTFWKNGKHLATVAGELISFNLNINPSTTGIALATDKVEDQSLITYNDHKILKDGTGSWCLYLPYENDPAGIIIPAMEIIRFYYATSTLLSKAVFNGDFVFNWEQLVNPDNTGMKGKRCVVHRREHVEDNDCWTIGRIQNDTNAYQGVIDVLHSMVQEHANGKPAHPKSGFPFIGKTTLKARCKQIGWKHKRWLVLSLISCSGAFPYDELEVIADNSNIGADSTTDIPESEKKPAWKNEKKPEKVGDLTLQSGAEPEADTRCYKISLPDERFSAISGKKIIKTLKSECHYKSGELKTIVTPVTVDMLGTGDGVYSKTGVAPASISVENKKRRGLPSNFETLDAMLKLLNSDSYPGASAQWHVFPLDKGQIKASLTRADNKRQWGYLDFDAEEKQIRRFMMADITIGERHCALIEVERRSKGAEESFQAELVFHSDWHAPNSADLIALSKSLSIKYGRMKNINSLPNGLIRLGDGLRHTWASANEYAVRVVEAVQAATM